MYLVPALTPGWASFNICYGPVSSPAFCCWTLGTKSQGGFQICIFSCMCPSVDLVTTILISPFTLNSVGLEDYALTVEVTFCWSHPWLPARHPLRSRPTLAVPWQPALNGQYLLKNLWCYHALTVFMLAVNPCYLLPPCPNATRKWNCCQDWWSTNQVMYCDASSDEAEFFQSTLHVMTPCCLTYTWSHTTSLHIIAP